MKFKKVEIDAFRAYKSKEDGTFDFTYLDDSSEEIAADLIAIYGPNGFGKTSFYDAVEWGMTNRIKRLDEGEELAKDERKHSLVHVGGKSKQYILKNRDVKKEYGEVTLTLEDMKLTPKRTKELTKAGQNDYFFKPDEIHNTEVENSYFKDVILSQEGIDAFLRESKPEERYQRFVEYYDSCKDADRLYKNITQLLLENDNAIRDNKKDFKDKQKEIQSKKIPENIVAQTNGIINNLKKQDCIDLDELIPLDKNFSDEEINDLSFIIDEFRNEIIADGTGLIPNYENDKIAIDNLVSELPTYLRAKVEKSQAEAGLKRLGDLKFNFDELKALMNERRKREEERGTIRKELNTLLRFEDLRPKHDLIKHDIDSKIEEIESLKNRSQDINEQIVETTSDIEKLKLELNSIKSEQEELQTEKAGIESKFDNYISNLKKQNAFANELRTSSNERKNLEEQQKQANMKLTELQKLKREVNRGMENEIEELADPFPEVYEKLNNQRQILVTSEGKLKELEKKAENIQSLKELHGKIISFGKRYILETKSKKCPLCGDKQYTDFNELLTQIEKSNILSQEYEDIAGKIKKQEEEIQEIRNRYEDILKDLEIEIDAQIKDIKAKLVPLDQFINKKEENEKRLTQRRDLIDSQIEQYKNRFKDKTIEEIKAGLNSKISESEQKKKRINAELTEKEKQESGLKIKKIDIQKSIDIKKGELEGLQDNVSYIEYSNLIDTNPFLQDLKRGEIGNRINDLRKRTGELKALMEDSNKAITRLEGELRKEKEEDVLAKLEMVKKDISFNEGVINLYERKLSRYSDKIPTNIKETLESKKKEIGKKIVMLGDINIQLGALKGRLENLDELLSLKKLKADLSLLQKEKNELDNVKKKLRENKENLSRHIESLIKKFFEEKLINDIYQRIDPHPEYKDIGFQPDLSGKYPKLNIYVEKEKGVMSPNLFLSTAQINVLSLSIFLAKALNVKDDQGNPVDTIFIDDPIQSMDSINILSVIDLIRTIIHQHKKQVIVSTHDENFFNLLKKKIPAEYYPAKFIEFETFGKVKSSTD
jgi:exonuclease SbcC